jgi:hypothetical protein
MATDVSGAIAAMILERQKIRETETAKRRESAAGDRVAFKRRRTFGLERRHAAKLARNRERERLA